MNEKIREQILAIRATGATNMFHIKNVERLASDLGYHELVDYLQEHSREYVTFILNGDTHDEAVPRKSAAFLRKPGRLDDLITWDKVAKQRSQFVVEKTIELEKVEFDSFAEDLFSDQEFIKESLELMKTDRYGIKHCLLIKARGESAGILVESEGYDYPRYAAYLKG